MCSNSPLSFGISIHIQTSEYFQNSQPSTLFQISDSNFHLNHLAILPFLPLGSAHFTLAIPLPCRLSSPCPFLWPCQPRATELALEFPRAQRTCSRALGRRRTRVVVSKRQRPPAPLPPLTPAPAASRPSSSQNPLQPCPIVVRALASGPICALPSALHLARAHAPHHLLALLHPVANQPLPPPALGARVVTVSRAPVSLPPAAPEPAHAMTASGPSAPTELLNGSPILSTL